MNTMPCIGYMINQWKQEMSNNISVGFYTDNDQKNMVGLTTDNKTFGLTPELARHLAVDLMIWADRLDPPKTKLKPKTTVKDQQVTDQNPSLLHPFHSPWC